MKKNLFIFILLLHATFINGQTLSPSVLSASGAFYSAGGYLLSQTVGELAMVQTFTSGNSILTQGFQQPEPILTGINENELPESGVQIYPNPASDFIYLVFTNNNADDFQIKFFNAVGQLVNSSRQKKHNQVILDVRKVSSGLYFLQIESSTIKQTLKLNISR